MKPGRRNFAAFSLMIAMVSTTVAQQSESICGTQEAMKCRPAELHDAPAIGIDLTMAYGTVAVKLHNGTTVNVASIDGSPFYKLAMRQLAEDARYIRAGSPSNLPQYNYHRPEEIITSYPTFPYYTPRIVYKWLQQKWSPPALKPPNTDPRLAAIAEMLIQLKTSITAFQIAHNYVLLSWPDFEADTGHIYPNLFYLACELAGLQCLPRSAPAFRFAIEDARIDFWEMCTTESSDPLCRGPRTALALNYNAASLGITLLDTKEMGVLWPVIAEENVELGAGSALHLDDAPQYWARIKAAIQESLQHERIPLEHLMLLGNHVDNGEFLEVVEQVLEERGYTDVWPNLMITDPVFAAARGAAHIAWIQMEREFGCDAPRTRPSSETEKQRDEL